MKGRDRLFLYSLHDVFYVHPGGNVLEDDGKFVAAETRNGIARPEADLKSAPHFYEKIVTDIMTEAVVDDLEAVKIREQNGIVVGVGTFGAFDHMRQTIQEQGPVGQSS